MSQLGLPALEDERARRAYNIVKAKVQMQENAKRTHTFTTIAKKKEFVDLWERMMGNDYEARALLEIKFHDHKSHNTPRWVAFTRKAENQDIPKQKLKQCRLVLHSYTHHPNAEKHSTRLVRTCNPCDDNDAEGMNEPT